MTVCGTYGLLKCHLAQDSVNRVARSVRAENNNVTAPRDGGSSLAWDMALAAVSG